MESPYISVIMPAYNRSSFIGEAINGILNQTFQDWELIIIDDASTDKTLEVINSFEDGRIKVISNDQNLGVAASRNIGISIAKGTLIAFHDSDDTSEKNRFELQLKVFKENPKLLICGTLLKDYESGRILKLPEKHNEIKAEMLRKCSLSIGTAIVLKQVFEKYSFDPNLRYGEDYKFLSEIIWTGDFYNLQKPLLCYRGHSEQLSLKNKRNQVTLDKEIQLFLFNKIAYPQKEYPNTIIYKVLKSDQLISVKEFKIFLKWLNYLLKANRNQNSYSQREFRNIVFKMRSNLISNIYFGSGYSKSWRLSALINLSQSEVHTLLQRKIEKWISA